MIWLSVALLIYLLIGTLLLKWAVGNGGVTTDPPTMLSQLVILWPAHLRFFWWVRRCRMETIKGWAEKDSQNGSDS